MDFGQIILIVRKTLKQSLESNLRHLLSESIRHYEPVFLVFESYKLVNNFFFLFSNLYYELTCDSNS